MIAVVCQSRSGSSLLMKIILAHGFDLGKVRSKRRYENYENLAVHSFFQLNKSRIAHSGRKDNDLSLADALRDTFLQSVSGDAALKVMIQHEDLARAAFPDAFYIYVIRDAEAVAKSLWKKGRQHLLPNAMMGHANHRNDWIKRNAEKYQCPIVQMSRLMEGDLHSLEAALEYCGVEMQVDKVNESINRDLWTCQ